MAGASKEMGEAILINPNSKEEIAGAILEALEMPVEEQRRRNVAMQKRLQRYDVVLWAKDFVRELEKTCAGREVLKAKLLDEDEARLLAGDYRRAERRLLMLDYDGTLMAFSVDPQEVRPSTQVLELLVQLCADPMNDVVVISGRDRSTLELWLGDLPVGLIAEHGVWVRYPGEAWAMTQPLSNEWKANITPVLELYADRLPGAFVEEKDYSLVWHYRAADPELGSQRAQELLDHLVNFTANIDVQILQGHKVIEVKSGGVNKGTTGLLWLQREQYDFVLAVGDDWTDEYLFAALPTSAYTVRVGLAESKARFSLHGPAEVLEVLEGLVGTGEAVSLPGV
jgi:trehalose 6-phosphate synthase/phosphatase